MAFGGGTKPAMSVKTPKVVQTSHKGPALSLPKPSAKGITKPGPKGCCGNK